MTRRYLHCFLQDKAHIISNWQWIHCTQKASAVTRSPSNRAPLGCGRMGGLHHGYAAHKSAATVMLPHKYEPILARNHTESMPQSSSEGLNPAQWKYIHWAAWFNLKSLFMNSSAVCFWQHHLHNELTQCVYRTLTIKDPLSDSFFKTLL